MVFFLHTLRPGLPRFKTTAAVTYKDGDTPHQHTFDFLVIYRDGSRMYVAVKPAARVVRSDIELVLRLIATQLPPDTTTDPLGHRCRLHLRGSVQCDASLLNFHHLPVKEHDDAMTSLIWETSGAVQMARIS